MVRHRLMSLTTKLASMNIAAGRSIAGKAIIPSVADVEISLPLLQTHTYNYYM